MPEQTRIRQLVETLFLMTPAQLELLETRREAVLAAAGGLTTLDTAHLKEDSPRILRALTVRLTGLQDVRDFFPAETVRSLHEEYQSWPKPEFGSAGALLEVQLGILVCRICNDYVAADTLYAEHTDLFRQQISRVSIRDDITREINWPAARDAVSTLLKQSFSGRYDRFAAEHGSLYRASRLANEALCIAKRIIAEGL